MPYGEPKYYDGKYVEDKMYPLYIQRIRCSFKIKKNHIPTIQLKNTPGFLGTEYLESSSGVDMGIVVLTLTSVDLKLFLEQYKVEDLEYLDGWKFKSISGIFTDYIDKWVKTKNKATIEGNLGMRTLAKLMMNSLYR